MLLIGITQVQHSNISANTSIIDLKEFGLKSDNSVLIIQ
jgi:hypothetical protein